MAIEVPACKIRMLDSLNFMPTSLSKLPKMFGIQELKKGYFPHLFNSKANRNAKLDKLPDVIFYSPDEMKETERDEFMAWYAENQHKPFDLQFELEQYCRSDVDILRRCCQEFRKMFMQMTSTGDHHPGIDPFESSITIASACNLVFRTLFLDEDSIGIIPPHGYRPQQKQSIKAYKWLKYLSETKGIVIQHAFNGGEERLNPFLIDGIYEEKDGKKIALEFHGCFWHGCPKCFARETINPVSGLSMNDLYQQTLDKKGVIEEAGYVYNCIWECDFDKDVANDPNLKAFTEGLEISTPLEPRDAFYGGRTEAFTLYKEAQDGENIQYYDVTSLYPYINKTGKVPLGHPKIVTESFDDITNYEGLIKCKVVAPRKLLLPVLPAKINNKLMFSLCNTCTTLQQKTPCTHSKDERAFTGTWVTDELKKAIEKGYEIVVVYEVWHFDRIEQYDPATKTGGIFTNYINKFLQMKQEASGFPSWCITEEEKRQYIAEYWRREGVQLDYSRITKNPGLRTLAKLMLNRQVMSNVMIFP